VISRPIANGIKSSSDGLFMPSRLASASLNMPARVSLIGGVVIFLVCASVACEGCLLVLFLPQDISIIRQNIDTTESIAVFLAMYP